MQASSLTIKKKLWHKISLSTNRYLAIPNLIEFGLIFFKKQLDLQIKASNSIYIMGYSRKKSRQGGWGYTFLKTPWKFPFFYFTLANFRQDHAQPWDIPQNSVRFLGNSKTKNKVPCWKFHITFSCSPLEIPLRF